MECPICKSKAEEIEKGFFDGHTVKCPVHGEFEYTDTVNSTRMNEPRGAWEHALTNARKRAALDAANPTVGGKRPRIKDDDFL
jgi:hypothetical protein